MHRFYYKGKKLYCENVSLTDLVREFGTPLYVYSRQTIVNHFETLKSALSELDHRICYAVKANSNIAIIKTLADLGSGFDIVSEGELRRVIAAGGDPSLCVFAGVGKTESEIEYALKNQIYSFNVESEPELERINQVARRLGTKAPIAIRVNPNVDAHTHSKITTGTYENKFGISFEKIPGVYARASKLKNIQLKGVQMHIGSQLTSVKPFEQAVEKVAPLAVELKSKYGIEFFSIGGGIGIVYKPALASGTPEWWKSPQSKGLLTPQIYAKRLVPILKETGLKILIEPGRFIVGNAGVLITKVEYIKKTGRKNFIIVDSAMNDLIRPAFYDSYHEIVPLIKTPNTENFKADVVGPICESGDYFCKDRTLPKVKPGDYLVLMSAGAYGTVMGSNYNSRPFPPEVMVDGSKYAIVRRRQPVEKIWELESIPNF
ncbi:MAG: diaminopimelate decarboxylase [Verrucomicrobiia bacterium]